MPVAVILISALVIVGGILYLFHRNDRADTKADAETDGATDDVAQPDSREGECCGMHITCERDSLLASVSDSVEYYDDEELDAYRGRRADAYTDEEIEQFRDVMLTLLPEDIAGWARSIQLRGIELPEPVRDELLLIVAEARRSRQTSE